MSRQSPRLPGASAPLRDPSIKLEAVGPMPQHHRLARGELVDGINILPEDVKAEGPPSIRNAKHRY